LTIHDHLITFDREVEFIWRCRLSVGSVIFLINRYTALAMGIVAATKEHEASPSSCAILERVYEALFLVLTLISCLFAALRASLFTVHRHLVFWIIFGLSFTSFVIYTLFYATGTGTLTYSIETHRPWCQIQPRYSVLVQRITVLILLVLPANEFMRICVLISDMGVLLITWTKTFGSIRQLRKMHIASVTECLVRDGTLYFITFVHLRPAILGAQGNARIEYMCSHRSGSNADTLSGTYNATRLDNMLGNSDLGAVEIDSEMTLI
ncbi:hypothetical protein BC629DRAFT_1444805, partial [Irpex lacteus]